MIVRSKQAVRDGTELETAFSGQNSRNPVRVHVSYRAILRRRAFRPYEAFPPAEARRLVERFEVHYTPKHGSWLNMAESELGVLSSQCLDRRIPDKTSLIREVDAWQAYRNIHHAKANWQFTTADARVKLKHLYPSL